MRLNRAWQVSTKYSYADQQRATPIRWHLSYTSVLIYLLNMSNVLLAMGPGNPLAVCVWTAIMDQFSYKPDQNLHPLPLGAQILHPDLSTAGFYHVWKNPSVSISSCAFPVSLFLVAFIYATVKPKILTSVNRWLFRIYWPPWWSKKT